MTARIARQELGPEQSPELTDPVTGRPRPRILESNEAQGLKKKGFFRRNARTIAVLGLLATATAAVGGGVAGKRWWDALEPVRKLEVANKVMGYAGRVPLVGGRAGKLIRDRRDDAIRAELEIAVTGSAAERLALANRVRELSADSPQIQRAIDKKIAEEAAIALKTTVSNTGQAARRFLSSAGSIFSRPSGGPALHMPRLAED